jgi:hypothetical protein
MEETVGLRSTGQLRSGSTLEDLAPRQAIDALSPRLVHRLAEGSALGRLALATLLALGEVLAASLAPASTALGLSTDRTGTDGSVLSDPALSMLTNESTSFVLCILGRLVFFAVVVSVVLFGLRSRGFGIYVPLAFTLLRVAAIGLGIGTGLFGFVAVRHIICGLTLRRKADASHVLLEGGDHNRVPESAHLVLLLHGFE